VGNGAAVPTFPLAIKMVGTLRLAHLIHTETVVTREGG